MTNVVVIDFFCGGGGFGLAFKSEGFNIAKAYDFNRFAVQSYNANVGNHAEVADIKTLKGRDIPRSNVWSFGFPCQDLSIANINGKGLEGSRSGMFYEIMRLVNEVDDKPELLIAENVSELKNYLPVLESEFNKAGYVMRYRMYNSKDYGVPQSRERYYVVGIREDLNHSEWRWKRYSYGDVKELSSVLEDNVDNKYFLTADRLKNVTRCDINQSDIRVVGNLNHYGNDQMNRIYGIRGVAPTLLVVSGGGREIKIKTREGVRKMTPREYARCQGFPDTYKFVVSNSQLYKIFGNAISIPVGRDVAQAARRFLELC